MLPWGQLFVTFEVLWPQRLGNDVLLAEPLSEIDQLATLRAKRTEGRGEPIARLLARRAFDLPWYSLTHAPRERSFSVTLWQQRGWTDSLLEVTFRKGVGK